MGKFDAEIDRLFQLPPAEFTAARNALARSAGRDGAAIKELSKPPLAAWAVNQLHWKEGEAYDALIEAATDLRRAHKAVLEGRAADLRSAGKAHEDALDAALKATVALMKREGQPVTDATRHAILNTLRALPSADPPGRLTRTLSPGGFEMLAGIQPQARGVKGARAGKPAPKGDASAARETAKARERRAVLERAVRDADQRARRAEFEAARAARESTKAEERVAEAREALEAAERAAATTARAKETADRRVRDAQAALEAARTKLESA